MQGTVSVSSKKIVSCKLGLKLINGTASAMYKKKVQEDILPGHSMLLPKT